MESQIDRRANYRAQIYVVVSRNVDLEDLIRSQANRFQAYLLPVKSRNVRSEYSRKVNSEQSRNVVSEHLKT